MFHIVYIILFIQIPPRWEGVGWGLVVKMDPTPALPASPLNSSPEYSPNFVLCPHPFTEDCYSNSFPHRLTLYVWRFPLWDIHTGSHLQLYEFALEKPSGDFRIGLNENANSFFASRCRFLEQLKIAISPVTAVQEAALCSQTQL